MHPTTSITMVPRWRIFSPASPTCAVAPSEDPSPNHPTVPVLDRDPRSDSPFYFSDERERTGIEPTGSDLEGVGDASFPARSDLRSAFPPDLSRETRSFGANFCDGDGVWKRHQWRDHRLGRLGNVERRRSKERRAQRDGRGPAAEVHGAQKKGKAEREKGEKGKDIGRVGDADRRTKRMQESSFREFASRPENKHLMDAHQRKEMKKAMRLQRKTQAARFQQVVMEADYEAQKNIAPFLEYRSLKRVVQTFTNDPNNDFGKWACNPRVLEMLYRAKEAIDNGTMTEEEVEHMMLSYIKSDQNPGREVFKMKTQQKARLATEQLVGALNEHLEERRAGNDAYKAKKFEEAMHTYQKALSIVNLVAGMSSEDQKEIDVNKASCLLNIAAVHIAKKEYGSAIRKCTEALEIDDANIKGLLRRAKAYAGRREFEKAHADLSKVKDLEPWNLEAEEVGRHIRTLKAQDADKERALYAEMFSSD